jgi:pimeloyl-ACP methyl ester carboxylesterase
MWEHHIKDKKTAYRISRNPYQKKGVDLLLIHGAGGSSQSWLPQLNCLDPMINACALDLPGHGDTKGPGKEHISDYADWVINFLESGPVRPFLLGHSMGGAIAMTVALTRPDLIKGLILIGTGARLKVLPSIINGINKDFIPTVELIIKNAYAKGADPKTLAMGVELMAQTDPLVLWGDFMACDEFDVRKTINRLDLPSLILVGAEDKLTPVKYSHYLAQQIPNARIREFSRAGHMVSLEQYKLVNQALAEFLLSRPCISR